jgi:hypothetical protein
MEIALERWKERRRMTHQLLVVKVCVERSLVALSMLAAMCVLVNSTNLQVIGAGCCSLWFTDACANAASKPQIHNFEVRKHDLFRRIKKQSVQLAAHVIIILTGLLTPLPLGELAFGVWFAAFLLEIGHRKHDLEGTVMMFNHFVCLLCSALVCSSLAPLRFTSTALIVSNATDIPVGVYKLLKLYHHGKTALNISLVLFINVYVALAILAWCPVQPAAFTLHGVMLARYVFAQMLLP